MHPPLFGLHHSDVPSTGHPVNPHRDAEFGSPYRKISVPAMPSPGPVNGGTHSGVIDRATGYSGGRSSKACVTRSESRA
jgi:hypothetical protein